MATKAGPTAASKYRGAMFTIIFEVCNIQETCRPGTEQQLVSIHGCPFYTLDQDKSP